MPDDKELKARIEDTENDLSFFSLYGDEMLETEWMTSEGLNDAIDETLDDLIDARKKLNKR
ncbi:MAG: diguanylate cyclase [Bacteroides sp.]|nr:diguanylate cyclase [Bacteroides sp.]